LFCVNEDDETKRRVIREVCNLFSKRLTGECTTVELAYERNRIVESITGDKDPMRELKKISFDAALKMYPKLKQYVDGVIGEKKRLKTALRIALSGNSLEFGAQDHEPNIDKLEDEIFNAISTAPHIDDSSRVIERIMKAKKILYVTDNAAEVVFDKILIEELDKYAQVSIAPLSRPVQDDASMEEIRKAGIIKGHKIIPRGDSIGVWFDKVTKDFQKIWDESELVFAKGMGCYETLSEYPEKTAGKVALLMKVKCVPVSRDVKAPLGSTVIKLI